jgi:hypothetical protein
VSIHEARSAAIILSFAETDDGTGGPQSCAAEIACEPGYVAGAHSDDVFATGYGTTPDEARANLLTALLCVSKAAHAAIQHVHRLPATTPAE